MSCYTRLSLLGCHSCFVFFDWEHISKLFFFFIFDLADKIFHSIDPMRKLYQKYIHLSSAVKFVGLYVPGDISL